MFTMGVCPLLYPIMYMKGESSCYICGKDGRVSVIKPLMILGTVFMAAPFLSVIVWRIMMNHVPTFSLCRGRPLWRPVDGTSSDHVAIQNAVTGIGPPQGTAHACGFRILMISPSQRVIQDNVSW